MTDELTERQEDVLLFVQYYIESEGFPPTRNEIAQAMNYQSANAAQDHLNAIERKGWIELKPRISRGIRLIQRLL